MLCIMGKKRKKVAYSANLNHDKGSKVASEEVYKRIIVGEVFFFFFIFPGQNLFTDHMWATTDTLKVCWQSASVFDLYRAEWGKTNQSRQICENDWLSTAILTKFTVLCLCKRNPSLHTFPTLQSMHFNPSSQPIPHEILPCVHNVLSGERFWWNESENPAFLMFIIDPTNVYDKSHTCSGWATTSKAALRLGIWLVLKMYSPII